MVKNGNSSRNAPFNGADRRAFERHPVNIDALVNIEGAVAIHRKIKDFCLGGMLLADEYSAQGVVRTSNYPLPEGRLIDIKFRLGGKISCHLRGRVVRQDTDSVGVALVNPDLSVMLELMNHTTSQQNMDYADGKTLRKEVKSDVIAACTEVVSSSLRELAGKTLTTIVDTMFEESKTIRDITEQNRYFETLGVLNNQREHFIEMFVSHINETMIGYQHGQLPSFKNNEVSNKPGEFELAIIEEEALDNWLADTGTIESVQRAHNEILTKLCRRLSEVFKVEVRSDNNPYGPSLFTTSFGEAMSSLGISHKMVLVCHKIFKRVLVGAVGAIYKDINEVLVKRGVLPNIGFDIPGKDKPSDRQEQSETEIARDEEDAVNDEERVRLQDADGTDTDAEDSCDIQDPQENHNIYELVAELRTLKRQLKDRTGTQTRTTAELGAGTPVANSNIIPLTRTEVIDTLARIESSCENLGRSQLRELINSSLSGNKDEHGEAKGVLPREERIIDVSNSIFDTILSDIQVPPLMHNWLAKMEIPVMKMAIEDDSLFLDRDHLVRQVVNKIAQLGLLIGEEKTEGTSGVKNALDWLVNLVGTEYDGTLSVFKRVSDQLDLLIRAQDSKVEKRLHAAIEEYKASPESQENTSPDVSGEFESSSEHESWLRRARRLEEGDWIMFDLDTEHHKRLRAGWVAHHTGKVVFVDSDGRKDRVLFLDELAAELHSGRAMPLDDANEPAMDRAQYSMLQELNEQLVHESTHDQLTGLINRREFEKQIGKVLVDARHSSRRHVLCFIDLDQFNVINTTFGYEAGDMLLSEMAEMLVDREIHTGMLARLGSDEFGLLLEDIALEDGMAIANELVQRVREYRFMWEGKRVSTGASAGLVSIGSQAESISSLMQAAESSCNIAKDMGGNRLQLYSSGQRFSHRSEIVNWAARIDDVLENDRLKLRCQRIQPITSGKPHYEILLGLVDDNGETVSIQPFIEAAEWGNRIGDIDRWVIKSAMEWIARNAGNVEHIAAFSINLSGRSLSDEGLVDYIVSHIEKTSVPAEKLCFEITETIGVENLSDSSDFIKRIKETGCKFSLDDFGSGMSSYAYLKNLPVDYLKIDGTFIKDMKDNISDYAVVKSICEIGHFMGKRVVAEYVEDKETIAMLKEIGVDYIQGFGVEKPLMINELLAGSR